MKCTSDPFIICKIYPLSLLPGDPFANISYKAYRFFRNSSESATALDFNATFNYAKV
jgi:hypothetical protein